MQAPARRPITRALRSVAIVAATVALAAAAIGGIANVFFVDKLDDHAVEQRLDGSWDCKHAWWRLGWFGWDYECELTGDSAFTCMNVEVDASEITARSKLFGCHLPDSSTTHAAADAAKGAGLLAVFLLVLGGIVALAGIAWSRLARSPPS